jgi:hypothetical protein
MLVTGNLMKAKKATLKRRDPRGIDGRKEGKGKRRGRIRQTIVSYCDTLSALHLFGLATDTKKRGGCIKKVA